MATHPYDDDPELRSALERLFSLQTFGIKLGLEPITALLEEIGNPHLRFPAIHVAGTNGKGSVCAMLASILQAAGLRVGLYTSPHLLHFTERIRVNGRPMGRERLALYAREMLPMIEHHNCTFFEGTTAIGFRYFAEEEVDIAVIETGLGGRLDATNVITPLVSAITSIGYDHTKHLGETLEEIAGEKAGIIKKGVPAVVGYMEPRLRGIFQARGAEVGADVRFVDECCRAIYRNMSFDGTIASFKLGEHELHDVRIDLVGRYQIENARVALGAIGTLRERYHIDEEIIRRGLGNIRASTGIRGRFELLGTSPPVLLDVAHNADGVRVLVETLAALGVGIERKVRFVYGAVQDKDVGEIARILGPITRKLYAVRADNPRSLSAEEIVHHARGAGIDTVLAGSVEAGIKRALEEISPEDVIIICGSFFVVADALTAFDENHLLSSGNPFQYGEFRTGESRTSGFRVGEPSPGAIEPDSIDVFYRSSHEMMNPSGQKTSEPSLPLQEIQQDEPAEPLAKRPTVKDWNPSEQPRERLMQQGPQALSDAELLAILLRTGTKQEDVLQVSRNILQRFRTFSQLSARDYSELQQIAGIGPTKAVTLAAAFEIGRRMGSEPFTRRPVVTSPGDVARIYVPLFRGIVKEQFHIIILNTANQVIRMGMISEGSLNSSIVHPREVFRIAIAEHAASIIGVHNHPSGNPTPSREDINITDQLVRAGAIIGIPLRDHIIIAGEEYVSMADRGYL